MRKERAMDPIKEFIFTASPWGKSDPGWMVFATSPGFDTGLVEKCAHWFRYGRPEGMHGDPPEEELGNYPVQYVVARPFRDGAVLMSQTTFTGRRWYDPRPGDWFAHGLVLPGTEGQRGSPFAWYRSPSILTCYQDEWKEKAKAIREKKIPWEAPPALPEPGSLEEVEANCDYSWNAVLDRVPEGAWGKIGALLEACAKRREGAKALVFDARKPESLDTMAALLELLPARMRWEAQFATYFHADNVRETKADETFLFYGTIREGEKADADTGLYGALPGGGVAFAGRGDAEAFKRMVDACGEKLGAGDWDDLVSCWEVATGRIDDPGKLRTAVKFAKRFPGLEGEVAEGLAGAFSDSGVGSDGGRAVALAAWFELGMGAFGNVAKEICGECAGDGAAFGAALRTLEGDGAKAAFLDETYTQAKWNGRLPGLAAMWLGCGADAKHLVPADSKNREFGKFAALVDRFAGIRDNVSHGWAATDGAAKMLKDTERATAVLGDGFDGMEETRKGLRYLVALEKVKGFRDLEAFAWEAYALGVDKAKVRKDGLQKVPLGWFPGDEMKAAVKAFGAIGVEAGELIAKVPDDRLLAPGMLDALVGIGANRDEVVQRGVDAAEDRGYQRGLKEGRMAALEEVWRQEEEEARKRGKGRVWAVVKKDLITVGVLALCVAVGYGVGRLTMRAAEKAEGEREQEEKAEIKDVTDGRMPQEESEIPVRTPPRAKDRPKDVSPVPDPSPSEVVPPPADGGKEHSFPSRKGMGEREPRNPQGEGRLDGFPREGATAHGAAKWKPGERHPEHPHVSAGWNPGIWEPDPGYVFVEPGTDNLEVKWQKGQRNPKRPQRVSGEAEGTWIVVHGHQEDKKDDPESQGVKKDSDLSPGSKEKRPFPNRPADESGAIHKDAKVESAVRPGVLASGPHAEKESTGDAAAPSETKGRGAATGEDQR